MKTILPYFILAIFVISSLFLYLNQSKKVEQSPDVLELRNGDHFLSRATSSPHVIVEYFDFDCPFCKKLHLSKEKMEADYSKVTYVIRPYPATGSKNFFSNVLIAECIYNQKGDEGYLSFLEMYYKENLHLQDSSVVSRYGYLLVDNKELFKECLSSEILQKEIVRIYTLEIVEDGRGTPSFYVYKDGLFIKKYTNLGPKLYRTLIQYYSSPVKP